MVHIRRKLATIMKMAPRPARRRQRTGSWWPGCGRAATSRRWPGPPAGWAGGPGLAERQVARQDDVLASQRDEQRALHGPRADAGNRGELGQQLIVGQGDQGVRVQPTVRHSLGQVAQRADLTPGQAGLAEPAGIDGQQFGRRREMPVEQRLDAGHGAAGGRDGQLLTGDLEQQGAVQVHRRQLGQPRPWVEVRPCVDEPSQHRIGVAQVAARLLQPRGVAGVFGH
jgi:hypothetical protein